MPNQANFRSDVTTKTEPRFLASRIVKLPTEPIFYEEIPASFGYDPEDNVELHFYSIPSNQLTLSIIVKLTDDILKTHLVEYVDKTYKNYIRIDFTKLFADRNLVLVPGDYRMVINLFSDEIGSYNNKKLFVRLISPSRKEVELGFNDTTISATTAENNKLAKEFVEKSFNKFDAIGLAEKIFKSGITFDNSEEGVTYRNVFSYMDPRVVERINRIGLTPKMQEELNRLILDLYKTVVEEIVINEDQRLQEDEYKQVIWRSVYKKFDNFKNAFDSRLQIT